MTIIIAFALGLLAGAIPKGIHIHIHKEQQQKEEKKVEYNESLTKMLPPEVQQYYSSNNGYNKF
jgi:hypothetical protein